MPFNSIGKKSFQLIGHKKKHYHRHFNAIQNWGRVGPADNGMVIFIKKMYVIFDHFSIRSFDSSHKCFMIGSRDSIENNITL